MKIIARQLIRLFRLLADFLMAAAIALMMALLAIGLAIALPIVAAVLAVRDWLLDAAEDRPKA